jgi:hypothetical protein
VSYIYFPVPKRRTAAAEPGVPETGAEGEGEGEGPDPEAGAGPGATPEPAPEGESEAEFEARSNEFVDALSEFDRRLVDSQSPASFDELVGDERFTRWSEGGVQATPLFSRLSPPEDLLAKPELLNAVFAARTDREVGDPVTTPDGHYFFKLVEVKAPEPKPLDQARAAIEETLKAQKVAAAVNEAAAAAKSAITESLAAGKTIAEAATAAGFEAVSVPVFASSQTPVGPDGYAVRSAAAGLSPGELSPPQETASGAVLVYLDAREMPLDLDVEKSKAGIQIALRDQNRQAAFLDWFRQRKSAADPTPIR